MRRVLRLRRALGGNRRDVRADELPAQDEAVAVLPLAGWRDIP